MWFRRLGALVLAVLTLLGCSGAEEPGAQSGTGAESAEQAVKELFALLAVGEFASAASLAVPDQSALAALAEGASVADVVSGLRDGDEGIAANFWSGFAQSIDGFLDQGVEVVGSEPVTTEGVDFTIVEIVIEGGDLHHVATRDVDGHRVDLFATFGPALAGRLYPQIELLFETPSEDASFILSRVREQVPSLYRAVETPDLAPNVVQDLLQLIELITRIN
jgi:hypothetical protein